MFPSQNLYFKILQPKASRLNPVAPNYFQCTYRCSPNSHHRRLQDIANPKSSPFISGVTRARNLHADAQICLAVIRVRWFFTLQPQIQSTSTVIKVASLTLFRRRRSTSKILKSWRFHSLHWCLYSTNMVEVGITDEEQIQPVLYRLVFPFLNFPAGGGSLESQDICIYSTKISRSLSLPQENSV